MQLETELNLYESIKADLLKNHAGKHVLIIGTEQLGIFDHPEEAYKFGIENWGNVPMLIKQIEPNESVELVPAMVLGLLYAHP